MNKRNPKTRAKDPELPSRSVERHRQSAHDFMLRLEELVMALEWAEEPVDEAVSASNNQVTKLSWARVKDKIKKVKEAP
jgi:hypothetical protein